MLDACGRHVALVVRVSSDQQDTARQIESVRRLAADRYPGLTAVEYFEEEGVSATKTPIFERPQGKRLCDAIAVGQVDVVVADEQSRLVRGTSSVEWSAFYELCREAGTKIHTVAEGVIEQNDSGELIAMIRAWDNRREIAKLRHRVQGGQLAAARAGRWPFGTIPYGFEKMADGTLRRTDAAVHVATTFEAVAAGTPKAQACAAFSKARGKDVNLANFTRMLKNKAYIGRTTLWGETVEGVCPPLVSVETFDKVQRILIGLSAERRREPTHWPFAHVAKCSSCGGNLRFQRTTAKGHSYAYVACRNADCTDGCSWQRIPAIAFSEQFGIYLAALAANAAQLMNTDPTYAVPEASGQTANEARENAEEARQRVRKLARLIAKDALDEDDPDYLAALAARDAAETALHRITGEARNHRSELADFVAAVEALRLNVEEWPMEGFETFDVVRGWHAASFEQQRGIVAMALDHITVSEDGSTSWHFRQGLAQPLHLPALVPPGTFTARVDDDNDWRHLDLDKLDQGFASASPDLAPDVERKWNVLSPIHSQCLAPRL
ncbi:MAG TPA: recombinase family protein [Dehalococcoidia bacterium]